MSSELGDANIAVKHWQDLITFRNRQGTSRQEIVLHVNDDQRVALGWLDTQSLRAVHAPISRRCCENFNTLRTRLINIRERS